MTGNSSNEPLPLLPAPALLRGKRGFVPERICQNLPGCLLDDAEHRDVGSLMAHQRTRQSRIPTSALPPEADIVSQTGHVGKVPGADVASIVQCAEWGKRAAQGEAPVAVRSSCNLDQSASSTSSRKISAAGWTRFTEPTDSPAQSDIAPIAPVVVLSGTQVWKRTICIRVPSRRLVSPIASPSWKASAAAMDERRTR